MIIIIYKCTPAVNSYEPFMPAIFLDVSTHFDLSMNFKFDKNFAK